MNFIIKRKILISMLFIASTMLGYISYKQLKMEMFPNAELPMLYVQVTSRTEVTPEYMEQNAIIPVESAIAGLENIELIESSANRKRGTVYIYYRNNTDLKYAYLKLDERIASLSKELPDEFNLRVIKVDTEQMSNILMTMQVRGSGDEDRIRNFVDQRITPELENIDGVAAINVYGGQQKSVDVILNKAACDAYGIAPTRVRSILSRNMNVRQYGGTIKEEGERFFVYLNAEYQDITQIEDLVVGRGRNPVQLKDIAEVFYGNKDVESISRVNGKAAITLMVINDAQANIIDLAHNINEDLEKLNKKFEAYDIEIIVQEDAAELMEDNINQIINLALTGGLLAIFILWVFLRNISLVIVVALAMPVSIYSAFNFFFGFDVSINSLTLVGIALAVGMLLDTSVVVLENIYRLRTLGYKPSEAVLEGTSEVWRSILAATLTTIAVFIPFVFSTNYLIQLLGKHIGVSIISTLAVSLLVSLLLIPMVVHKIIARKTGKAKDVYQKVSLDSRAIRLYLFLLKTALRNPAPTIIGVLVLFFVTILASMSVSVNKLSSLETDQIKVYFTMSSGSTLETTDKLVAEFEAGLTGIEEIKDVVANIEEEEAVVTIILQEDYYDINKKSFGTIYEEIDDLGSSLDDNAPANISMSAPSSGGGSRSGRGGGGGGSMDFQKLMGIGEDEEHLVLKGQDFSLMIEVAEALESYIEELENIRSTNLSIKDNQPEVHLDFNTRLMTDYDITLNQVHSELGSFQNEIGSGITFSQGTEEYEIMIKYDESLLEDAKEDKTMDELRILEVPDSDDENLYDLESFADIYYSRGMREISRVNQEKQIVLRYRYEAEVYDSKELLEFAREEIQDIIENAGIPPGVAVELVQGESELDEFKYLFLIALLLVYMILAIVFESFVTPFVLLFSIPLAAIGSFFFLTITGNSLFNANTLTGFLILLGVVVNNGIILIDFVNILRDRGYRRTRAIMLAGLSRVRPIMITAVTTCVAMLPLAMGKAEYVKAIGPPFAVTVIGGLTVSTLLTLVFIPMLYNGIEHSLNWIRALNIRMKILLLVLEIAGLFFVIFGVETFIWKMAGVILVVAGIPAGLWFVTTSLRKAKTRIISEDERLHISIANLVKIYGRDGKAVRDYRAGVKMSRLAEQKQNDPAPRFQALIWQIPLLGFLIYFSWFYLVSASWKLIASIAVWYFVLIVIQGFRQFYKNKWLGLLLEFIRYVGPILILILFYQEWKNLAFTLVIAGFWYLILAIRFVAYKIRFEDLKVEQTAAVFRWFVWLVKIVPGIGSQKEKFKALRGVSLEIGTGMFGLLGPNGAGKSTMIRTICGILEQSYGKIWINGIDTQEKREELQGLIGYLPQEFGMYENMTAEGYLDYLAILKGLTDTDVRKARIEEVIKSVHMWESRNKKIGSFSGGMKQRIGIAQVLLHLPRILVVDEPTAGLDPRERIRFRNLLVELSRNRIVIFSTHIIEDISSSCNTMAVINDGEVLFNGTPHEMTDIAKGKVWKVMLPAAEFEERTKDLLVMHHMRDNDQIRVRCISAEKPFDSAVEENPLLEDAYLWLLRSKKQMV
ncbi:MAG: efflux RND transporter permease subunit [Bacteroidales bacterium]|nr:efflux RND transporter permease subunit [Bacteroidales bacterium]